jgi:hypothetical protein
MLRFMLDDAVAELLAREDALEDRGKYGKT